MPRKTTHLLLVIFGLLAILATMEVISRDGDAVADQASGDKRENRAQSSREGDTRRLPPPKRERSDATDRLSPQEMEREFDKILPAKYPNQHSSLCDATLEPGETLVLGGFRKTDGDYEFTMLEVVPVGADGTPLKSGDAAPQYKVTTRTFGMSREKSLEMGLGSLISPAKTRIQKSIAFPPGDTPWYDGAARAMTCPSVATRPDVAATISMGTDDQAYVVSMIVSRENTGNSLRLRTRIESP